MPTDPLEGKTDSRLKGNLLAALSIFLFALLICRPVLAGRVPIASDTLALWAPWSQQPHSPVRNTTLADSAHLYLAWEVFARGAVSHGEWPLWDPYSFAGTSFAANAQNRIYYPLSWLLWLLPLSGDLQALALFNICLAGTGMYLFARAIGVSWAGGFLAGLTFAGSGMLQTAIDVPGVASAYGWLGWMLFTCERALVTRTARWTAAAALCFGLQAVAGHLQWALYSYFAAGCWLLFRSFGLWPAQRRRDRSRLLARGLAGSLARSALIVASGPALAAVHLVPFIELTSLASRTGARVSSNSDPATYLLRLILPNYFGTPLAVANYPLGSSTLWYCGLAPLFFAGLALILRPRGRVLFWAALALFAVLVTYGVGPFLNVRWLPGLQATLPVRIGFLLIASVSVLSGLGLDAWLRDTSFARRRAALAALTGAVVLLLGISTAGWATSSAWTVYGIPPESHAALRAVQQGELVRAGLLSLLALLGAGACLLPRVRHTVQGEVSRGGAIIPGGFLLLTVADLLLMSPDYSSFVEPSAVIPSSVSVRWLRQQPGEWRMLGLGGETVVPSFVPNSQLIYGLQTVDGYDSLHLRAYDEFWAAADPSMEPVAGGGPYSNVFVRPQAYSSTAASLLGVKYVVSAAPVSSKSLRQAFSGDTIIYENTRALPRAFLAQAGRTLPKNQLLTRLTAPGIDPLSEILFEEGAGAPGKPNLPVAPSPNRNTSSVAVELYQRNSVAMKVTAVVTSWLVLADSSYPGWRADVDGSEVPIYTADHILRAVRVPSGVHTVRFRYLPSNFVPAFAVSVITLLCVLAALLWPSGKRRGLTTVAGR